MAAILPQPRREGKREMTISYIILIASATATIGFVVWLVWLSGRNRDTGSVGTVTDEETRAYDLRLRTSCLYAIPLFDTEELALLPCGASLRRLHDGFALSVLRDQCPFAIYGNALRDGDTLLFCPRECANALGCPLLEKYVKTVGTEELESFAQGLVREFKAVDGNGDLPHVGDYNGQGNPCKAAPIRLKGACICHRNGDFHFVVAPMAKVVHEGDQGGCGSDHAGDHGNGIAPGGKESNDNIFHGGNATTPTEAMQA